MDNQRGRAAICGVFGLLVIATLRYQTWQLFEHTSYRIDIHVHRMGFGRTSATGMPGSFRGARSCSPRQGAAPGSCPA
jgi:hypothetical protein